LYSSFLDFAISVAAMAVQIGDYRKITLARFRIFGNNLSPAQGQRTSPAKPADLSTPVCRIGRRFVGLGLKQPPSVGELIQIKAPGRRAGYLESNIELIVGA
jgi:hypothetical protein